MELRVLRATVQLLHRPPGKGVAGVVRHLLAVQAQDLRSARLALRARREGLTAGGVDAALRDERSLVVAWLGRGTLHMVCRNDYPWLLGLTAPTRLTSNRRRLGQEGLSPEDAERAVAVVERALADEGPLTRTELRERIAARGIRAEGQSARHVLALAALRGAVVLGPMRAGEQAFALTRDWLGVEPPAHLQGEDRDAALAELARRYLAAHGPATAADLATWAGLPLRDARAGLGAIAPELTEEAAGLVRLARHPPGPRPTRAPAGPIAPRLLPSFDPYLLGWRDRAFAVPGRFAWRVHPGGGIVRAVATVDGLAVGTWGLRRRPGGSSVTIEPFSQLDPAVATALEAEAADVTRFEDA